MEYLFLLLGFLALIKGADIFVDGASNIAKFFKIPSVIVGLTIVSIGTSLPEASVSITAGLSGVHSIGFGNVVGSNIFNTAVVLGLCSLIKPIKSHDQILKKDFPFMLFASTLTFILMLDGNISSFDGIILLVLFTYFIVKLIILGFKSNENFIEKPTNNMFFSILFLFIGSGLILVGGNAVVSSAKVIATTFGLSDSVIGLTVVAVGTSLPELVTSLVAARKGESDIALGNVIGSNLFNFLFILSSASIISPLNLEPFAITDMVVFLCIAFFSYIVLFSRKAIERVPAFCLVLAYIGYNAFLLIR